MKQIPLDSDSFKKWFSYHIDLDMPKLTASEVGSDKKGNLVMHIGGGGSGVADAYFHLDVPEYEQCIQEAIWRGGISYADKELYLDRAQRLCRAAKAARAFDEIISQGCNAELTFDEWEFHIRSAEKFEFLSHADASQYLALLHADFRGFLRKMVESPRPKADAIAIEEPPKTDEIVAEESSKTEETPVDNVVEEPVKTDKVVVDESSKTEETPVDNVVEEPSKTDEVVAEPAKPDEIAVDNVVAEPSKTDEVVAEPAKPDGIAVDTDIAEPAKPDEIAVDNAVAESSESNDTEPSKTDDANGAPKRDNGTTSRQSPNASRGERRKSGKTKKRVSRARDTESVLAILSEMKDFCISIFPIDRRDMQKYKKKALSVWNTVKDKCSSWLSSFLGSV